MATSGATIGSGRKSLLGCGLRSTNAARLGLCRKRVLRPRCIDVIESCVLSSMRRILTLGEGVSTSIARRWPGRIRAGRDEAPAPL